MDYRLKENRREAFIRWYAWSLQYKDCDPSVWLTQYLNKRFEHNDEQKIWFCWLYGNTYHLPTAWVLFNEFPDFELATVDRMMKWNNSNYTRLRYQTDTKWNKGHLPVMFESYQKFIGNKTQRDALESLYGNTPEETFENYFKRFNKDLWKFGRYMIWFYTQHLKHTANINVFAPTLKFNDSGSSSHRNGFLYMLGMEDALDKKLSQTQYNYLESVGSDVIVEMKQRFPELKKEIDNYTMETCLCSYKKIFRKSRGRYLGYYLDRQAEEIKQVSKDGWHGIDWNVLWQARKETVDSRLNSDKGIQKDKYSYFLDTGKFYRLSWMFNDETDNVGVEQCVQ